MKLQFPLFVLASAAGTVAAVVRLTPDPTRDLLTPLPEIVVAAPADVSAPRSAGPHFAPNPARPAPSSLWASAPPPPVAPPFAHRPSGPFPSPTFSPRNRPPEANLAAFSGHAPARTAAVPQLVQFALGAGIPVPHGASVPVALFHSGSGATKAQIDVLDRIADEFTAVLLETSNPPAALPTPHLASHRPPRPSDWDAATRAANERYRQIFGVDAYNAWTSAAARDALSDRTGLPEQ